MYYTKTSSSERHYLKEKRTGTKSNKILLLTDYERKNLASEPSVLPLKLYKPQGHLSVLQSLCTEPSALRTRGRLQRPPWKLWAPKQVWGAPSPGAAWELFPSCTDQLLIRAVTGRESTWSEWSGTGMGCPERWWRPWRSSKNVWMLCWETWFSKNPWWQVDGWTGWSCGSFPTLAILWFYDLVPRFLFCNRAREGKYQN